MAASRKVKLGYLASHPIQYQAPLLRRVAAEPDIDFRAFFASDFSMRSYVDPGFGTKVEWDVPLLEGYEHEFLMRSETGGPDFKASPPVSFIEQRLRENKIEVLWMHGYAQKVNMRAILAAKRCGIKVVVRAETRLGTEDSTGIKRKIKEIGLPSLFRRIDAFMTIGSLNEEFLARYGVSRSKQFRVPYAVDNSFFQAKVAAARPNRETLRQELGLEPGRPVILFASKFEGRKRVLDLVEAYARLSPDGKQEPTPYLLYIGDGETRGELAARIMQLGWRSIQLLGFKNQSELPAYFDLCDVFVLPSYREAWGLIVNEVMNAGKAVVVSHDVGSAPDLVEDGVNGYVFPVFSIEALSDALKKTTEDPTVTARMGAASLEKINQWSFEEDLAGIRKAIDYVLPGAAR